MLFQVRNIELVKDREKTYLTRASAVAATSLTVRAVDSNAWANDDWIIVGEIGSKNAEILQIAAAVSDGTSLTIDNAGSGGARFAHAVDEPVYRIDYNQVFFYRNTTDSTTGLTTLGGGAKEIQVDDEYTRYEDTTNSTGYGFVRFYNSTTTSYSSYSDGIPYTGYGTRSLGRMMRKVRKLLGEQSFQYVEDEDIADELNEAQRDIAHERLWPFFECTYSDSRVAYKNSYDISSNVAYGKVHTVTVESDPIAKIPSERWNELHWDSSTTGEPTHCVVWNGKLRFYPTPSAAATSTTLNGDATAVATSITLTSTSGFSPSGRVLIDSEVISYNLLSSTQLLGCVRGEEGTTAAAHSSGATVTERDIIYTGAMEPTELKDMNDLTSVPDPAVLEFQAAANLAIGKMNDAALHDRLKMKGDQALERLRDKFGRKFTSQQYRIRNKEDVVSDLGVFKNPNDYPQNLS